MVEIYINDFILSTYDERNQMNLSNYEILRPGFTRISLPFFMSESEMAYVLESIKMVATEGWKLLPQYLLYPETGEWRHNSNTVSNYCAHLCLYTKFTYPSLFASDRTSTGSTNYSCFN